MSTVSQTSLRSGTLRIMLIKLTKSVNFEEAHIENHLMHLTETLAVGLKQVPACTLLIELTKIVNFSRLNVTKNAHL